MSRMIELSFQTTKKEEIVDITEDIEKTVLGTSSGVAFLLLKHTTAFLAINESADPGIKEDFLRVLSMFAPEKVKGGWAHGRVHDNATAHLKASLIGPSLAIPVFDGRLALGEWQRIWLCEFDGPRARKLVVKVMKG
ncbi:MAG: secondary thiamine-phosphate synthase enzyme YjbQ [Candidatus Woesearchaeota archaeon]